MTPFRLAFLGLPNEEGKQLFNLVKPIAESLGFRVETPLVSLPQEYMAVCANYDAIILDASLKSDQLHNYKFAMPSPAYHILVVSRTKIPLNFYGLGDSYPYKGEKGALKLLHNSPLLVSGEEMSNEDLLSWISMRLKELSNILTNQADVIEKQKQFFRKPIQNLIRLLRSNPSKFSYWQLDEKIKEQSGQIFISFRNKLEHPAHGNQDAVYTSDKVKLLKERIEKGQFNGVGQKAVRYFPPNSISSEIMSEQRRWQILSMIDRYIGPAEEFWIYESSHYYNSWWTLGELLTLSYRQMGSFKGVIPKVRIFRPNDDDPNGGQLIDVPDDFLPQMTLNHKKRMARWYANCDPSQMAPESVLAIRAMPHIPLIGKLFSRMKYYNDHVWSRTFWEDPILDCFNCRDIGHHQNRFNIDDFLWSRGPWFSRFSQEEVEVAIKKGFIECKNCGCEFKIKKGEPHYFWLPPVRREIISKYYAAIFGSEEEIQESEPALAKVPVFLIG